MDDNVPKGPGRGKPPRVIERGTVYMERMRREGKLKPKPAQPAPPSLQPNWTKWQQFDGVTVIQAVILACDLDPEHAGVLWFAAKRLQHASTVAYGYPEPGSVRPPFEAYQNPIPKDRLADFLDRLDVATSHVRSGRLPTKHRAMQDNIGFADFVEWTTGLPNPWTLPPEFPRTSAPPRTKSSRWPWGTYETDLLRKLAAAGVEFFAEGKAAPQKKVVAAWLRENGVDAGRTAEVMAQILCG
jgi:hypothetical protein